MKRAISGNRIAVIVPARDEQDTVAAVVSGVRESIAPAHVIVVDDASHDRTASLAAAAGALIVRTRPECRGLGAAMNLGVTAARSLGCDTFLTIDADGQYDPQDLSKLLRALRSGPIDIVVGNRLSGGRPEWMTHSRYAANRAFSSLFGRVAKFDCPLDSQSGLRAFGVAVADLSQVRNYFTYTQEQLLRVQLQGLRIGAAPVGFGPRRYGMSRLVSNTVDYAWKTIPNLFEVYRELSQRPGGVAQSSSTPNSGSGRPIRSSASTMV